MNVRKSPQNFPRLSELRTSVDGVELLNIEGRVSFVGGQGMGALSVDDMSDLVGRSWLEFWPESERQTIRECFDKTLAGSAQSFQTRRMAPESAAKEWEVTLSPVPNTTGHITSVLAISRAPG